MKLRIKGNSIRIRITQTEIKQLGENRQVIEETRFNQTSALNYILQIQSSINEIKAELYDSTIRISLPQSVADNWLNSDQVGLDVKQEIGGRDILNIVIEKDFSCLRPRGDEDESDLLPNPKQSC